MTPVPAFLICSDDETYKSVSESLSAHRAKLIPCATIEQARALVSEQPIALVVVTSEIGNGGYREIMKLVQNSHLRVPVIVLSRVGDWREYLEAKQLGAYDCVPRPLNRTEFNRVVSQALTDLRRTH